MKRLSFAGKVNAIKSGERNENYSRNKFENKFRVQNRSPAGDGGNLR